MQLASQSSRCSMRVSSPAARKHQHCRNRSSPSSSKNTNTTAQGDTASQYCRHQLCRGLKCRRCCSGWSVTLFDAIHMMKWLTKIVIKPQQCCPSLCCLEKPGFANPSSDLVQAMSERQRRRPTRRDHLQPEADAFILGCISFSTPSLPMGLNDGVV